VADLEIDETELSGVAAAVAAARADVELDQAVTRGSLDVVGVSSVAETLDGVTQRFARRIDLLRGALERLSGFPSIFRQELARTESGLVAGLTGGGSGAGVGRGGGAGGAIVGSTAPGEHVGSTCAR
jgi:hypothetical protein